MNVMLSKIHLRLAAAAMVLISIAAIATSVFLPIDSGKPATTGENPAAVRSPVTTQPTLQGVDFSAVLDVQLRRPLSDPHPTTTPSALSKNDPAFGVRLVGTIMDPMHPYAVLADSTGKTVIKSTGDRLGSAVLLAIDSDSVTLQMNGRPTVLHVVKPSAIGTMIK